MYSTHLYNTDGGAGLYIIDTPISTEEKGKRSAEEQNNHYLISDEVYQNLMCPSTLATLALLNPDSEDRLTAAQALEHVFMKQL